MGNADDSVQIDLRLFRLWAHWVALSPPCVISLHQTKSKGTAGRRQGGRGAGEAHQQQSQHDPDNLWQLHGSSTFLRWLPPSLSDPQPANSKSSSVHFVLSPVLSNSYIAKFYQTHPRASGLGTLTNVYPVFQILTAGLWQTFQSVRELFIWLLKLMDLAWINLSNSSLLNLVLSRFAFNPRPG